MRPTLAVTGLWLALAALLLTAPCAQAQSLPRPGSITIYGLAGAANQQQDSGTTGFLGLGGEDFRGPNDVLWSQQELLRNLYDQENGDPGDAFLANYDVFGLGSVLGGGAWFQMMKRVSVGLEYSHQNQELQNDVFVGPPGFQTGILNGAGGKIQDLTLNVTWYPPLDEGIFFGAGLGYGWSEMYQELEIRSSTNPDANQIDRGDWTADGITGQLFMGYHFNFVWGTRIQVRGGYRHMQMNSLEGQTVNTVTDPTTGQPISTPSSEQLELGSVVWDFSGFNAVLVLGIPFFGSDEE